MQSSFEIGRRRGLDPRNDQTDGPARTTQDSAWWDSICERCGHSFREGDAVVVESSPAGLSVLHSMDLPPCTITGAAAPADPDLRATFFAAVARAENEKLDGDEKRSRAAAQRLSADHPLILGRKACLFCGTTIRPYEAVVICPCALERNPCQSLIHHDPAAGLDCFDQAFPGSYPDRCPTWFTKVRPPSSDLANRPGALAHRLAASRTSRPQLSAVILQVNHRPNPGG